MSTASFIRLICLAAIWGAAFLFMKIATPALGPVLMIQARAGFGLLFLAIVAIALKKSLPLKSNWKHFLILGLINSAIPFFLFAYAVKTLPTSMMAILNATSPMWGAVIGAVWTGRGIAPRTIAGLILGVAGVVLLVGYGDIFSAAGAGWAIAAVLLASVCYGISTTYANAAVRVDPFANAYGTMWAATLLIVPFSLQYADPVADDISIMVIGAAMALGVLCSGIAYLLYFRLVQDEGATSALTVTFLIPVFGLLWGRLFLSEQIGWHTILGSVIVLIGTALVTGFRPNFRRFFQAKKARC